MNSTEKISIPRPTENLDKCKELMSLICCRHFTEQLFHPW